VEGVHIESGELDLPAEALEEARSVLSGDERRRADRFLREDDRARFTAARALLRRTLGQALGERPERLAFAYGARGKPALAAPFDASGLRFNLSHSAGRALLAMARDREIGVDLERIRPVRFGPKIAHRFFSDDERHALDGLTGTAWDEGFFRCWTRKEAFIKAVGDGLSFPLKSFSVPMGREVKDEAVRVHDGSRTIRPWILSAVDAGPGFLAAIVVESRD
jgi:4'-phosphopantetheinyl transferase